MVTKIYIERHGQTLSNEARVIMGHQNMDLTERGESQAELTAAALKDVDFAAIYSSDLGRTMQTASYHETYHNLKVIPDERLRELYIGEWEGKSLDSLAVDYPELFERYWKTEFGTFVSPGGESVAELVKRIEDELILLAKKHLGETILVVSHGAAIRALYADLYEIPPSEVGVKLPYATNASYSIALYDSESDKLIPVEYSIDGHLAGLKTEWKD